MAQGCFLLAQQLGLGRWGSARYAGMVNGDASGGSGVFFAMAVHVVAGSSQKRLPTACQRSFNWQSTAFVMRGLWVRLPPLALQFEPAVKRVSSSGVKSDGSPPQFK